VHPFDIPVSFDKILFATDFHDDSAAALPYLIALARRCNSHVFITHVVPSALPAFFRGGQRLRSAGVPASVNFASDHLSGISHEFLMRDGEVAPTLCRLARGYDVDLIVIRMRRRMATAALGTVAEEIIANAPCPVLTVGPSVPWQPAACIEFERILFATQSGYGSCGSTHAVAVAEQCGARLDLLHVVSDPTKPCDQQRVARSLRPMLARVVPPTPNLPYVPSTTVLFGDPAVSILKIAEQDRPDLIVMGAETPGAEAISDTPLITAYEVVSRAECPVLTVRTTRKQFHFVAQTCAGAEVAAYR
jgi:nucleotide-binding universal stress UspA family protein